jgi:hypothetical protein
MKLQTFVAAAAMILAGMAGAADEFKGKPYPLSTCPVSGEALDSMGEPVQRVVDGRDVKLCCAGCNKKFDADTAGYLAKIDEAIVEQQKAAYPLTTCVVSGQELGSMGEPISKVSGNQLVQLCCAGCVKKVDADPATYLSKIDAAIVEKQAADYPFDKCVVSGETLGEHGDIVDVTAGGRLVRLCCASCETKFNANPSKYLGMVESGKMDGAASEGSEHKD